MFYIRECCSLFLFDAVVCMFFPLLLDLVLFFPVLTLRYMQNIQAPTLENEQHLLFYCSAYILCILYPPHCDERYTVDD